MDNTTTLVGNLTRDPELRFTQSGQATASFGIAVNRTWNDRSSGERREQTSFFDVVAWGALAENAATSLRRGDRAVVTGRLEQRTWETQEGDKRSKVEVVADDVAPSLRWATAQVVKNDRRQSDEQGAPEPSARPQSAAASGAVAARPAAARPAAAPQGGSALATAAPAPAGAGMFDDEEPF